MSGYLHPFDCHSSHYATTPVPLAASREASTTSNPPKSAVFTSAAT